MPSAPSFISNSAVMLILIDVPDPNPTDLGLDLICDEMGWSNLVALYRNTDRWSPESQGTLSIKCVLEGKETYEVDGRRLPVHTGNYLILNQGQRYSSYLDTEKAESFCIFFRPHFVEETLRVLSTPSDHILDDPIGDARQPLHFFDKLYRHDDVLSPRLFDLYTTIKRGRPSRGWLEERFHDLMEGMLRAHRNVATEIRRLPSIRSSTRTEVYRRLSRAKDYIESNYTNQLTLAGIAREASLSAHHFLRLFKNAFDVTPHQYVTQLRIERARQLLESTDQSIAQICFDVGFESPSTFSLLFKRYCGVAPSAFRKGE